MRVPSNQRRVTLSSIIAPVTDENSSNNIQSREINSVNQIDETIEDKNSTNDKKRKKNIIIIIKNIVDIVRKVQIQKIKNNTIVKMMMQI